jgi:tetratricopeptide (TPR) repeat protein
MRILAARKSTALGASVFAVGFAVFAAVRSVVYAPLREFDSAAAPGVVFSLLGSGLLQALIFLLAIYIPVLVGLGNGLSGDGLGLSVSRNEYRHAASALLPLWGVVFLIIAPLQALLPQFLLLIPDTLSISIGLLFLTVTLSAYTIWAVRELSFVSWLAAAGVFVLSWATFPLLYVMTAFLSSLPFFLLFPLAYLGWQRLKEHDASRRRQQELREHLRILTVNPQDADARHQLGLIYLDSGRFDEAEKQFREAVHIAPAEPDHHYCLGLTLERRGDWAGALSEYEETYRLDPQHRLGEVIREVGKGYLHTGSLEKAREFLQYFLDARGSDPEGRFWLAVALDGLGRREEARAQLATILEQTRSTPQFFRKEHREWVHRARQQVRALRS